MIAESIPQTAIINNKKLHPNYEKIAKRGVLASAYDAGWVVDGQGWQYPVIDFDGQIIAHRWKAADSQAKPKYRWVPAKPADVTYYFVGDLRSAIANADGLVYLAAGEMDVLTFVSAGLPNVIAWFGEVNVPRTLADDLKALGVQRVVYLPDKDDAGYKSAIKVRNALYGSLIHVDVLALPPALPPKSDTNDLWQAVFFERDQFAGIIQGAEPVDLPEPVAAKEAAHNVTFDNTLSDDLLARLERLLGAYGFNDAGWSKSFCSPLREDKNPSAVWNRESGVLHDFATGESHSPLALADHFGLDVPRPSRYQTQRLSAPPTPPDFADLRLNLRYISQIPAHHLPETGALLIQSPIGTGKTELVKRLIQRMTTEERKPRVLVITHRQSLAQNISERLEIECYKSIPNDYIRQVSQLVIVYNSLWRLTELGANLPEYDLIIIDEIEQFHHHLGGGTFRNNQAVYAYQILEQLLKQARLIVGLDADASPISQNFFGEVIGHDRVTTIVNEYQLERGDLTLHQHEETVIQQAVTTARNSDKPVVIPTNSKRYARDIEAVMLDYFTRDQVIMISSENSNTREIQQFINEINDRLPRIKVLIFSPSLGTGVDITCPVAGVFAVFRAQPLSAPELMQMIGRCRKTEQTHVYIQVSTGHLSENWETIFKRYEYTAITTGMMCNFDKDGILSMSDTQERVLTLLAKIMAERNKSMNQLAAHFRQIAETTGYSIHEIDRQDETTREQIKAARKLAEELTKQAVLSAEPVDHETYDNHKRNQSLTPEIEHGHTRYVIEGIADETINESHYKQLHNPDQRAGIYQLADILGTRERCMKRDRHEAQSDLLVSRRSYYTARRSLLTLVIQALWGANWQENASELALTSEEIAEKFKSVFEDYRHQFVSYFGWREDQSHDPVSIVRWLLVRMGLRLDSRQVMQDGERFRVYFLEQNMIEQQLTYASNVLKNEDR